LDVLFIHQHFPGQFLRLAQAYVARGFGVYSLGDERWLHESPALPGTTHWTYPLPEPAGEATHHYVKSFEAAVRRAQQVVRVLLEHKMQEGFEPDVIYVHPGWGDGLFLREVFPNARIIALFEYYYQSRGADVGFDPEFPMSFNDLFRIRMLNTVQLHALDACDVRLAATHWQRSRYPEIYHNHIEVLHEGIDTNLVQPDPQAAVTLPDGTTLMRGDEVLTYVSRGLEPYRGFHCLMRALPEIQAARPNCRTVIVGGLDAHYGPRPTNFPNWMAQYLQELEGKLDLSRIHFTGSLSYGEYLKVLQVSRLHVYLTYPFVLSWSMLEAMAAGCVVLGSDTEPVREFIEHEHNGLLVPFFDLKALAQSAVSVLSRPDAYQTLGKRARAGIVEDFDFEKVILPRHLALLDGLDYY